MEFKIAIDRHTRYFRVVIAGGAGFERLLSLVHVVGMESEGWETDQVVFDVRAMQTPLDDRQRQAIGLELASSWRHMKKIALVVPAGQVRSATASRAARRSGVNTQSFDDPALAVQWLHED